MTIGSTDVTAGPSTTNGATVEFSFSFPVADYGAVEAEDQIKVSLITISTGAETVLTRGSNAGQYTVAINGDQESSPGGAITTITTYPTGYRIWIRTNPSYLQATALQNQGSFNANVVEAQLDQTTRQILDLKDQLRRSPKLGVQAGESFDGEITGALTPGNYVVINSDGDGYSTVDGQSASGTSVTATGSSAARLLADRFADVRWVSDFGSIGTASDFTAALQAAIAALAYPFGGVVMIPPGSYGMNADVTLTRSVTLRGSGSGATTITQSNNAKLIIGGSASTTADVWIEDLLITAQNGATTPAVVFDRCSRSGLRHCIFSGIDYSAIDIGTSSNAGDATRINIEDVVILLDAASSSGVRLFGGGIAVLDGLNVQGTIGQGQTAIDLVNTATLDGVIIRKSVSSRCDYGLRWRGSANVANLFAQTAGIDLCAQGALHLVPTGTPTASDWILDGCYFSGVGATTGIDAPAIHIDIGSGMTLSGVKISGLVKDARKECIKLTGAGTLSGIDLSGLVCRGSARAAAATYAAIHDATTSGVAGLVVSGNAISSNNSTYSYGVRVDTPGAGVTIKDVIGNSFRNCATADILFGGVAYSASTYFNPNNSGYLYGLSLSNNGSDATNDIDFAAGKCANSTNAVLISCSALTKQLDAAWAVGSAAGGLDAGSIANATYHCHAIQKDSTGVGDFIFSLSHDKSATCTMTIASPAVVTMTGHGLVAGSPIKFSTTGALPTGVTAGTQYYVIATDLTADAFKFSTSIGGSAVNSSGSQSGVHTCLPGPVMPTGYTYFRRIGSIIRSGATILAFSQRGDEFLLKVPVAASDSASPGTSAISKTLTTPVGIQTDAIVTSGGRDATAAAATYGLVTPLDLTDTTPTSALFNWTIGEVGAVPNHGFANLRVRTDTASAIRLRVDASTADLTLKTITHGWIDSRGRLG